MTSKTPQYIRDRRQESKQKVTAELESTPLRRTISRSWKIALGGITLVATSLGVVTGYLTLVPKVSVSQNQPLDPKDLFSTPFIVTNEGPLGINDVQIRCIILDVKSGGLTIKNIQTTSEELKVSSMEIGERGTFPCGPRLTNVPYDYAKVVFTVIFRPDFVPWHVTRFFGFRTLEDSEKRLWWYPEAQYQIHKEWPSTHL